MRKDNKTKSLLTYIWTWNHQFGYPNNIPLNHNADDVVIEIANLIAREIYIKTTKSRKHADVRTKLNRLFTSARPVATEISKINNYTRITRLKDFGLC